jgi:hypothetical protein
MVMTGPKTPRSMDGFSTLDDFLAKEGKLELFAAIAVKEVYVRQAKRGAKGGNQIGNAKTREAIAELEAGTGNRFESVKALMDDLHSDD